MEPLRKVFRGYDPEQVDRAVSELNSRIDALAREAEALRAGSRRLESELEAQNARVEERSSMERAVQEALVTAHRQAEEILAEARRESEVLLQVAREASMRLQDDLKGRIADLNWQIESLALRKQKYSSEIKELLERQLAELSQSDHDEPRLFAPEPQESVDRIEVTEIRAAAVGMEQEVADADSAS